MTKPVAGGRPKKITVKLTPAELVSLEQAAWVGNCTLSEVIRMALVAYTAAEGEAWRSKTSLDTGAKL